MECTAYLAAILDGYIARPDGSLDWLRAGGPRPPDEARTFAEFLASVDGVILGRRTFEVVMSRLHGLYGHLPVLVLSHHELPDNPPHPAHIERQSGSVEEVVRWCAGKGWRRAYVDGAFTVQQFLAAGCLQRLVINRVPVVLGSGISLFGPAETDQWFEHVRTQVYPGGLVQSEYRPRVRVIR